MARNLLLTAWLRCQRSRVVLVVVLVVSAALAMLNVGSMMGENSAQQKEAEVLGAATYRLYVGGSGALGVELGTDYEVLESAVVGVDPSAAVELHVPRIVVNGAPEKIVGLVENDWESFFSPERFEVVSGRLPAAAGEVLVDERLASVVGEDGRLEAFGPVASWVVTGYFVDRFPQGDEQFEQVLAAPGTWAVLDRERAGGFAGIRAIPAVVGQDVRGRDGERFVELVGEMVGAFRGVGVVGDGVDDVEYLVGTADSVAGFEAVARKGALDHRPVFLKYPVLLFNVLLGVLVALTVVQFLAPVVRVLRGCGVSERVLLGKTAVVVVVQAVGAAVAGVVVGLVLPWLLAPALQRVVSRPLGPWGVDVGLLGWGFVALLVGLLVGVGVRAVAGRWVVPRFDVGVLVAVVGLVLGVGGVLFVGQPGAWVRISVVMVGVMVLLVVRLSAVSVFPLGRRGSLSAWDVASRIVWSRRRGVWVMTALVALIGAFPVALSNTAASFIHHENVVFGSSVPERGIRVVDSSPEQVSAFARLVGLDRPFVYGLIVDESGQHVGFDKRQFQGAIFAVPSVEAFERVCSVVLSPRQREVLAAGGVLTADDAAGQVARVYRFVASSPPELAAEVPFVRHERFGNFCDKELPNVVVASRVVSRGWVVADPRYLFVDTDAVQQEAALGAPAVLLMDPATIAVFRSQGVVRPSFVDVGGGVLLMVLGAVIMVGGLRVIVGQVHRVRQGLFAVGVSNRWLLRVGALVVVRVSVVGAGVAIVAGSLACQVALRVLYPAMSVVVSPWPYVAVAGGVCVAAVVAFVDARRGFVPGVWDED
ncbi:hypothetical protein [Corynebacterium aquilae]|uniref:hypothetical protein n=1 Tax=Corynebacterium aquilae TaxID=203263 RepID=UPI0012ECD8A1|nr:hypothetical protein [Corynebacterium aquilae]